MPVLETRGVWVGGKSREELGDGKITLMKSAVLFMTETPVRKFS